MVEVKDEEIVVAEDELICALTGAKKKATEKELNLQSVILQMNEEYKFEMQDMQRDFSFKWQDNEEDKTHTSKVDLAIFAAGKAHEKENLIRICVVNDAKVNAKDAKKGVKATLHNYLEAAECDFGLWTNGDELFFAHFTEDELGGFSVEELSDFPGSGETYEDLCNQGERSKPRKPANDTLVRTFRRCHDYLYGNEGRKKDAFWELLNIIFCKIYDEKRRILCAERNESYHRKFWVGVDEEQTEEGQRNVAARIKNIFDHLKEDPLFSEIFNGNEQISISDRGLTHIAAEIAKYSFLDASVDVKGAAYETIVSNTLKQSAGQFFTPRNIIKCMVQMLDPDENTRVLDPACGSGGFIVMVLDHVRRKITRQLYPDYSEAMIDAACNSDEVNERVKEYAEKNIFGFDFDPDLRKAARMNMVMSGDGHANIFNINSLEYPNGQLPDVAKVGPAVARSLGSNEVLDKLYDRDNALGKFDMIFTNPPFGTKVEVDPEIASHYALDSKAPEVLFIEQCYNFLKPGGRMAIVLPDGILGNPNMEGTRLWILERFRLIASVDLPVEAFLPQVGVQASLLFLQKKSPTERIVDIKGEDYPVFMAIAETVGKDRRGVPIYERDEDGAELLFNDVKRWVETAANGQMLEKVRMQKVKHIDDDLPRISESYKEYLKNQSK